MKLKRQFIFVQLIVSALMSEFLMMGQIPFTRIFFPMVLMTLTNFLMMAHISDEYSGILCFLNTIGATLQISLDNISMKQGILAYGFGTLAGLLVYYGSKVFEKKALPKDKLRIIYMLLILLIFIAAFASDPVKNASGTEAVYGYVKGIAVYQFIVLLHVAFIANYITSDTDVRGIRVFLLLHLIEFTGFFLSKEFGTLLVLYLVTFLVLTLIRRDLFAAILHYIFRNKIFYLAAGLLVFILVLNHFVTLPLIGERMHQVIAAAYKRIFNPDTSQFDSVTQALSITRFANPHEGFVNIYAEASDMAFISISQRFGYILAILTLFSYAALLIFGSVHLMNYDTEEAQRIFTACLPLAISSLLPIAGALQVIPFTGMPIYFISEGTTVKIVSYALAYYIIYLRKKEEQEYV